MPRNSFSTLPSESCKFFVLRLRVLWRVSFQVMKQILISTRSRYGLGAGPLPLFPPALLNTMTREFLWGSPGTLQAPLIRGLLPATEIFLSGAFPALLSLCLGSSAPLPLWLGRDRRLEVIKSLLNYLMQDSLACLLPWLSSWASKQLRKQPFSRSGTRRKIPGMKDFCRRHLAQLEERFV